jgi:probable F420-dependent oxidoreductase
MRIGLFAPLAGPFATGEYLSALGAGAEERGFHSLWVAEHVVLFDDYASTYPYARDGRIPAPPESGILEPFTSLAYLAAATRRLRLGTGICLLPQRNPVYTAKEAANVDFLSGGRLDFGVGVGWLAEEFRAAGAPFERRGARCDAYLEVLKRLWCDEVSEYKGEFYELPACRMYPKPVQRPHPPIHVGGESDAALRRAARHGQAWYGFDRDPAQAAEGIRRLEAQLAAIGRPRSELSVSICPYFKPVDADALARYRDAGVEQVIVPALAPTPAALPALLDGLAEKLVEPARRL